MNSASFCVNIREVSTIPFASVKVNLNTLPLMFRHEEGLLFLRECLKSVRSAHGHAIMSSTRAVAYRTKSVPNLRQGASFLGGAGDAAIESQRSSRPSVELALHIPPCHLRMLMVKLKSDMASALRQASQAEKDAVQDESLGVCAPSAGPSCNCSSQILAALEVRQILAALEVRQSGACVKGYRMDKAGLGKMNYVSSRRPWGRMQAMWKVGMI